MTIDSSAVMLSLPLFQGHCLGNCFHTDPIKTEDHNECRATTGSGHDRAQQVLAVTHQLIKIRCTTWDLCHRPVANGSSESRQVNLAEEVAEG